MKLKKVSYELITRESPAGQAMYPMLCELVDAYHEDLKAARFALAWNTSWKADPDGRVTLGKCKKASDLDKELAAYDFVIMLRQEFWQDAEVKNEQRRALLDHELCHAAPKLDKYGEHMEDERGRKVWRTRKHDIEEFAAVVYRHGLWKRDLERMAQAIRHGKQGKLDLEADVAAAEKRDEAMEAAAVEDAIRMAACICQSDDIRSIDCPKHGPRGRASDIARRVVETITDPAKLAEAVALSPALAKAVKNMRPKKGSGITSVTLSSGGGPEKVILEAEK